MSTTQEIDPIHPGEHLAEYLEEMGLTQYRLAKDISVHPRRINQIIKGERSVTADTALRLARFFDTSAEFWLNLQNRYEIEKAASKLGDRLVSDVKQYVA